MSTCADPTKCGRPQNGPGRPRKGWIHTKVAGQTGTDRWWCSIRCLIHGFTQAVHDARDDVALCVMCINRHDRGHRCPSCNTTPHLTQAQPVPHKRLFTNLGRPA